ncbi:MAG: ATP-binding protein [Lachnospiraceae bacterium]|nr:ATP-binding protein [Lachnospiraceae bacterium]
MGLTNSEYDAILREYDELQAQNRYDRQMRRQEVYKAIPVLNELDERIASGSVAATTLALRGDEAAIENNRRAISLIVSQKKQLMRQAGFPEDYMELRYRCPLCKDTGFTNNEMCYCFKQAIIDRYYLDPGRKALLEKENFSTFNAEYYSDEAIDETTGDTFREVALDARARAISYVENFDTNRRNLLLIGSTGVGKTFLSNCIAKALMITGHTVMYLSAFRLFEIFEEYRFGKKDDSDKAGKDFDMILDCDLLIIDDLGSEIANAYTTSQLFVCMEERHLHGKPILISTNLTADQIRARYSERISSRLFNNYQYIKLLSDDIRVKKLFLEGNPD